jgi:asparagine synthetase B (glutamine-hydrolysing)
MLPKSTKSIAMLLSGGLDSACVAWELLNLQAQGWIKDIEIKFYSINNSEDAPFVKIFAERFGIKVETLSYDMSEIDLKQALFINETPVDLGSMVPNQKMFEIIPETIIFTGDGPDELFGGYNRIDQYDSQLSDTFEELPFYHFPRLNKAAYYFGKTLVCPFIDRSIISLALKTPLSERTHKKILKTAYEGIIPDAIISRKKMPLKNDMLRADPLGYRMMLVKEFTSNVVASYNTKD